MASAQPLHLPQPLSLASLGSGTLMKVLKGGFTAADLARLECTSTDFRLVEEGAKSIVIDPECPHFTHRLDFGRMSSSMRWLRILRRVQELSRPLHFTKAGPGIELNGSTAVRPYPSEKEQAESKVANDEGRWECWELAHPATAICGDYVMRSGIHNVNFTVSPHCGEFMGIGLVRAAWDPNGGPEAARASSTEHGWALLGPLSGVEGCDSGKFYHKGKDIISCNSRACWTKYKDFLFGPGSTVGFELDLDNGSLTVYIEGTCIEPRGEPGKRTIVGVVDNLEDIGLVDNGCGVCWMVELSHDPDTVSGSTDYHGESASVALAPRTEEMEQAQVLA